MKLKVADIIAIGSVVVSAASYLRWKKKAVTKVLGALALVAIAVAIFFHADEENRADSHNSVTTTGNNSPAAQQNATTTGSNSPVTQNITYVVNLPEGPMMEMLRQTAKNLADISPKSHRPNFTDSTYPGFGSGGIFRFGEPFAGRNNFVCDFGQDLNRNRFSLFINSDRRLVGQVFDKNSRQLMATTEQPLSGFDFSSPIYLYGEYGEAESVSFLRILLNGREVAYQEQSPPLKFEKPPSAFLGTMGTDISTNNSYAFAIAAFVCTKATFTSSELKSLGEGLFNYYKEKGGTGIFLDGRHFQFYAPPTNGSVLQSDPPVIQIP